MKAFRLKKGINKNTKTMKKNVAFENWNFLWLYWQNKHVDERGCQGLRRGSDGCGRGGKGVGRLLVKAMMDRHVITLRVPSHASVSLSESLNLAYDTTPCARTSVSPVVLVCFSFFRFRLWL